MKGSASGIVVLRLYILKGGRHVLFEISFFFFLFVSPKGLKGTQRLVEVEIIQNGFPARGNNSPVKNRLEPFDTPRANRLITAVVPP